MAGIFPVFLTNGGSEADSMERASSTTANHNGKRLSEVQVEKPIGILGVK